MRPSSSPFTNPSGLVDKRVGNMWELLERIDTYLPQVAHVSYYLENLFNLDRNLTLLTNESVDHHILLDFTMFQGANAYELAVAEGYTGTVDEWLASLVGPQGETGLLDEAAHQELIDGIAANAAAALAAQNTANAATASLSNYVLTSTYNTHVASVNAALAALETTITDVVVPLLPEVPTETEINALALNVVNTSLVTVNTNIADLVTRVDGVDLELISLQEGIDETNTTFGSFLLDYGDAITRIDVLEATSATQNASIVDLQTVTSTSASDITVLQASSATQQASIVDLQTVTANAAIQINALQVANNANFASIEELALAYVTADEAVALLVTELSARTDLGLLGANNVLYNWDLTVLDSAGRPHGIRGVESTDLAARTAYLTAIEGGGMRINGSVDATLAFGFPAIPINDGTTYKVVVKHKSSATSANGLYIRVNERSTALEAGKTHIGVSASGETMVAQKTGHVDLVSNGPMPGTTLITSEYTYTPTPGTWLASFSFYNWTGFTGNYDVISVQIIPRSDAMYAYVDASVLSETTARTSALEAAALDRTAIRTEFAAADDGLYDSVSALVTSEASARSTADGALASDITALEASVGDLSASVTTQATAIAGIDGRLAAKYSLTLNVDGKISGFTSEDDGDVASFEILADVFSIVAPGGGARTEFSDGNWRVYDASNVLRVRFGVWT